MKIIRIRFCKNVPAPTSFERHRPERGVLDLQDVGEAGFSTSAAGVSYDCGPKRIMVPWSQVAWAEVEGEPQKRRGRPSKSDD